MDEAGPEAFTHLLWEIERAGVRFFVVGGQAVNKWAELFLDREPALEKWTPFTSEDCDIVVDANWLDALEVVGGTWRKSEGPQDGQLAILTSEDQPPVRVDLLQSVYGIRQPASKILARAMDLDEGILFMEPLELFRSKCACLVNLPQAGRQDEKHLNILRLVIPHYLSWLLEPVEAVDQRLVLKQIKKLRGFNRGVEVRRALSQLGWNLDDLVPVDRLRSCGFEAVERYATAEWPLLAGG
jgi:hypothetical protein